MMKSSNDNENNDNDDNCNSINNLMYTKIIIMMGQLWQDAGIRQCWFDHRDHYHIDENCDYFLIILIEYLVHPILFQQRRIF